MSEKGIYIQKYDDGNEAIVVKFGSGKIGIGLDKNSLFHLAVHLQELKEPKQVGAFLKYEEIQENFKDNVNPIEVVLMFPDVKSVDNFIETLKIYMRQAFFPNARTRSA